MQRLSPRLKMAADMVREGAVAADIGTDHAYLPVFLVMSGKCPRVLATDIGAGPLCNAKSAVLNFSAADKIELRISDGLDKISPDDADDFIFAGMGGTLTAAILSRAPWIKDEAKRFIFQPMSHPEEVRAFLIKNGFKIVYENACFDLCRPYIAFCAEYSPFEAAKRKDSYIYLGELFRCKNDAAAYHFTKTYKHLKNRADALEYAGLLPDEVRYIRGVLPDLKPYTKI